MSGAIDRRTTGVLLGMIAGDAYVNVRERLKSGKYPYTSSEMRVVHGMQQRAYCEYKCELVNELLGRNSSVKIVANGPGGKYRGAGFTVSHPYFKLLKELTYKNGKKTFNEVWLDRLTPEGVALWYMDDGHARRNRNKDGRVTSVATSIATCCSRAEVDLICDWFRDVHTISFRPFEEGSGWSVQANTENSRLFVHLVQPHVIKPMMYKLAHVADLDSRASRAAIGTCQCGATIFDNRRKGLCTACYSRRYYHEVVRKRPSAIR